jgi:7-cyano-7-deazaguanine reductase
MTPHQGAPEPHRRYRTADTVHPMSSERISEHGELTLLGATVRHAVDHVEVFPAPAHVTTVRMTNDELTSMCPVTAQPDLATVEISYRPDRWCVESKSLKLYLWRFRDRAVFVEQLAAEIADEIAVTAEPHEVCVVVTQRPRGGIEVQATAERGGS